MSGQEPTANHSKEVFKDFLIQQLQEEIPKRGQEELILSENIKQHQEIGCFVVCGGLRSERFVYLEIHLPSQDSQAQSIGRNLLNRLKGEGQENPPINLDPELRVRIKRLLAGLAIPDERVYGWDYGTAQSKTSGLYPIVPTYFHRVLDALDLGIITRVKLGLTQPRKLDSETSLQSLFLTFQY
jgi:hypothetical protein